MKSIKTLFVAAAAALVLCFTITPAQAKDEAIRISNASKVFKDIAAIPKRKIPPMLLNEASAVVIFPKAKKTDFMVKGGSTAGLLLTRNQDGTWSNPVFVRISGGTLGWQIVADPLDIIMVFKGRKNVDALLKGRLDTDAKVKIQSGWLGPNMKGAPAENVKADIATYLRSHGKLADDFTVAGTTLVIDVAANDSFYGKAKVDLGEIMSGKVVKASDEVKALQKALSDYAAAK